MTQSGKGLKITLGTIVSVISVIVFITPYLELKARADQHSSEIRELRMQQKSDHDLIIEMFSDIKHIRREIDKR
jgi:hypothetical protein